MKQVLNTNGVDRTQACFQFLTGQGVKAWGGSTSYVPGDMAMTSGNFLWRCLQNSVGNPPTSSPSYWAPADTNGARDVVLKDAIFLGPPINYPQFGIGSSGEANFGAYPLVDSDTPIKYSAAGTPITFVPFSIVKDKLSYKTGFEASALDLKLRPRNYTQNIVSNPPYNRGDGTAFSENLTAKAPYPDMYAYISGANGILQTMRQSFATMDWYLAPLTMFRFIMPAPGDVTSYGAAVMFRGRLSEFEVDKEEARIQVASVMEIFKQKVPTQTIQPGNRWAPFNFQGVPDFVGGQDSGDPSGYSFLTLDFTSTPPTPASGALQEGWMLILVSSFGQYWRKIYSNVTSGNKSTVTFLDPLPFLPSTLGGASSITCKIWQSGDTATNPSGPGAGFPYVPQPLTGIT